MITSDCHNYNKNQQNQKDFKNKCTIITPRFYLSKFQCSQFKIIDDFQDNSSAIYLHQNLFATTSQYNFSIKIWRFKKVKPDRQLFGHKGQISNLVKLKLKLIASSSSDGSLIIWNWQKGQIKRQINKKDCSGLCLCLINECILVTSCKDFSIILINWQNGQYLGRISNCHSSFIYSIIQLNNYLLASSSDDGYIRIWNIQSFRNQQEIYIGYTQVALLKISEKFMAASSYCDGYIRIINLEDYQIDQQLIGHPGQWIQKLIMIDQVLMASVGQGKNATIKLWSTQDWTLQKEVVGHTDNILDVFRFNLKFLISIGKDGKIIIWK